MNMRFILTEEQRQLQQEIRSYLESRITKELLDELKENPDGGPS